MDLGKIIGTIVATQKDPSLVGMRLLAVQPISEKGVEIGSAHVAVDTEGLAGIGDLVYTVNGGDASFTHPDREMPRSSTFESIRERVAFIASSMYSIGSLVSGRTKHW